MESLAQKLRRNLFERLVFYGHLSVNEAIATIKQHPILALLCGFVAWVLNTLEGK